MKQINDIPVRRRPQSRDVTPGPAAEGPRPRRSIWEIELDAEPEAGAAAPASDLPEPKPARPRSTPLILTPADESNPDEPAAMDAAPQNAPAPVDAPVEQVEFAAPKSRSFPADPAMVPKRTASQPREPEAVAEPSHTPRREPVEPASARQRSRPIRTGAAEAAAPPPPPEPVQQQPAPTARVNRAKTRILGFHAPDVSADPLAAAAQMGGEAHSSYGHAGRFPGGWFVIVAGPGRGASFTVSVGVSTIGRGEDQAISLNFGDQSVSRSAHASVAYDDEQNKFFIGHGGKSNVVRRNGAPVLATEEMQHGDIIRIGKTSLKFVALCGEDFDWADHGGSNPEAFDE